MSFEAPTADEFEKLNQKWKLGIKAEETAGYLGLMSAYIKSVETANALFDKLELGKVEPVEGRDKGHKPTAEENGHNAWSWKCSVQEKTEGALKGKTIALKDTVMMAGIPMMNGSAVLEGFVPSIDATIVRRILDAGGIINGKTNCEDLCFSGGSHTCFNGPVLNPHDKTRLAGGSSSGSAVVVAIGDADMAIAGDQGGSIRIPACWCGIVGHKPTHGLVPYTGVCSMEPIFDNVGPHGKTVDDVALLLEVIAGRDGKDTRQMLAPAHGEIKFVEKIKQRGGRLDGLRVGILKEGFGWPQSDARVDQKVEEAAKKLAEAGATVVEVSVPLHRDSGDIWMILGVPGAFQAQYVNGSVTFHSRHEETPVDAVSAFFNGMKTRGHELSRTNKLFTILGDALWERFGPILPAKANKLMEVLTKAYDDAFKNVDVLICPTLPHLPSKIPAKDCSIEDEFQAAFSMIPNTDAFNITGHPAVTVPTEPVDGLPVGMMIVGRHWEDDVVLSVAKSWEGIRDRK